MSYVASQARLQHTIPRQFSTKEPGHPAFALMAGKSFLAIFLFESVRIRKLFNTFAPGLLATEMSFELTRNLSFPSHWVVVRDKSLLRVLVVVQKGGGATLPVGGEMQFQAKVKLETGIFYGMQETQEKYLHYEMQKKLDVNENEPVNSLIDLVGERVRILVGDAVRCISNSSLHVPVLALLGFFRMIEMPPFS